VKLFMRDLCDGYFPYELKEQYPDGVPFELVDKHHEVYRRPHLIGYAGEGFHLDERGVGSTFGGNQGDSDSESGDGDDDDDDSSHEVELMSRADFRSTSSPIPPIMSHSIRSQSSMSGRDSAPRVSHNEQRVKPQTAAQFLDKIPKHIIKNGNVVNLRDDMKILINVSRWFFSF
jgi:hypothetical protein